MVVVIACAFSIIPRSIGFEITDFKGIVEKKVGVDTGQNLYQSAYDYVSKFKKEGKDAYKGIMDLKNLTPLEALSKHQELAQDYKESLDMSLYMHKMADDYKRIGKMKLEQYKVLYKKYKTQIKNFKLKDLGNKAKKIFSKMKFLTK